MKLIYKNELQSICDCIDYKWDTNSPLNHKITTSICDNYYPYNDGCEMTCCDCASDSVDWIELNDGVAIVCLCNNFRSVCYVQ